MARIKAHAADPKPAEPPAQAADVKAEAKPGPPPPSTCPRPAGEAWNALSSQKKKVADPAIERASTRERRSHDGSQAC